MSCSGIDLAFCKATANCVGCGSPAPWDGKSPTSRSGHVHKDGKPIFASWCSSECHDNTLPSQSLRDQVCVGYIGEWSPDMGLVDY